MEKSVINKSGYLYTGPKRLHRLHPEQLVIHVLKILMEYNEKSMPIYDKGNCIGVIYLNDLVEFLIDDVPSGDLLLHKLNFDLESAIFAINRESNTD